MGPARIRTPYTMDQCRVATSEIRHLRDKRERFYHSDLLATVVLVQLELSS